MITTIQPRRFIIVSSHKQKNSILAHNKSNFVALLQLILNTLILVKHLKDFSNQSLKLRLLKNLQVLAHVRTLQLVITVVTMFQQQNLLQSTTSCAKITLKVTHKYDYTTVMYTVTNIIPTMTLHWTSPTCLKGSSQHTMSLCILQGMYMQQLKCR